jgi:hypothetical protein
VDAPTDQTEKRKSPRKSLDVMFNFKKSHFARSKDISKGGICLICDEVLETGAFLSLVFNLPNNEEIKTFGKIKWSRKASASYYEYGVEFWQLEAIEMNKINSYLDGDIE